MDIATNSFYDMTTFVFAKKTYLGCLVTKSEWTSNIIRFWTCRCHFQVTFLIHFFYMLTLSFGDLGKKEWDCHPLLNNERI